MYSDQLHAPLTPDDQLFEPRAQRPDIPEPIHEVWGAPFAAVVLLQAISASKSEGSDRLAQVIRQDPLLAAHVLRLASENGTFQAESIAHAIENIQAERLQEFLHNALKCCKHDNFTPNFLSHIRAYSIRVADLAVKIGEHRHIKDTTADAFGNLVPLEDSIETLHTAALVHAVGEYFIHLNCHKEIVGQDDPPRLFSLKRRETMLRTAGISTSNAGASVLRHWGVHDVITELVDAHEVPFGEKSFSPLAAALQLAVWRVRCAELSYDWRRMAATYPDETGIAIGMDLETLSSIDGIRIADPTFAVSRR
jgi:hypothetical protein